MEIHVGNQIIPVKEVKHEKYTSVDGETYKSLRIDIDGAITEEQLNALTTNEILLANDYDSTARCGTYNTITKHELILSKTSTTKDVINDAVKEVLVLLTDEQALQVVDLHPLWETGKSYLIGDRVCYADILYKALQNHTSQEDWTPDISVSLWAKVLTSETNEPLPWEQPESTNPYMLGDRVVHNGKTWESTIDNNVFEPGVAGWKEVKE